MISLFNLINCYCILVYNIHAQMENCDMHVSSLTILEINDNDSDW
jgi:hypothetical protein